MIPKFIYRVHTTQLNILFGYLILNMKSRSSAPITRFRDPDSNRRFEYHSTAHSAFRRASEIISEAPPYRSAVVFDIDDTILKNDANIKACDGAKPHVGVMDLYRICIKKGIAIWFITARPESTHNRDWTRRQLDCIGARWYTDLRMCPPNINSVSSVSRYKSEARQDLVRYHKRKIVMNIGDQWTDHSCVSRITSLNNLYTNGNTSWFLFETEEPNVEWAFKLPSVD